MTKKKESFMKRTGTQVGPITGHRQKGKCWLNNFIIRDDSSVGVSTRKLWVTIDGRRDSDDFTVRGLVFPRSQSGLPPV